ncbi:hypothetical protein F4X86_02240 [Candidatus Saccharibacteria bacterium]|nr:hypothetical protein [Candidatus Saccharibacteria bacterium]
MVKNKTTDKRRSVRGKTAALPAKRFPAKMIWVALVAVIAGALITGSAVQGFGSSEDSDSLAAQDGLVTSSYYPEVVVQQEGLTITARAEGMSEVSWRYKLINPGDVCGLNVFDVAPNDSRVQDSNRLVLPESAGLQDPYRNRFVCFKAVGTSDFYGVEWTHYGAWRIDLGNPIISVKAEFPGALTYLRASSSEDVTYRITRFEVLPRGGLGGSPADGTSLVGNYCEFNLLSDSYNARINWADDWETFADSDGRILVNDDSYRYCFEATDAAGNRTYVQAYAYAKDNGFFVVDNIDASQWKGEIRVNFIGTSGKITWDAVGPLTVKACDEYAINNGRHKPLRQSDPIEDYFYGRNEGVVTLDAPGDHGKYYCFRATDELGQSSYRYVLVDLQPPEINLEQRGGRLEVSSDKHILNSWFVGPLDDSEFGACAEIFAKDVSGDRGQLWWERGGRATFVNLKDADADGQYYCVEVEDGQGNAAVGRIKLDRQAPRITVTQNDAGITVGSSDADLDGGSWGYAAGADLDCDAAASFTDVEASGSEVTLDIAAEGSGRHYCFRAADKAGNYGYVKVRIQRPLVIEGVL